MITFEDEIKKIRENDIACDKPTDSDFKNNKGFIFVQYADGSWYKRKVKKNKKPAREMIKLSFTNK
jgi:hypothetical protein